MKLRALIILAFGLLLTLTVIVYDSTHGALTRLQVKQVILSSDKIPDDFNELNLVYFSDLHAYTLSETYYAKVIESINSKNPDFVVFGGDLIDESDYATYSDAQRTALIDLLKSIKAPYGKFAILSETDLAHKTELIPLLMEGGFEVLNGKVLPVHVLGSSSINFIGWDEDTDLSLLSTLSISTYTLAFVNDPDQAALLNAHGVKAVFAGKTHGGQVTLPLIGSLVYKDELYQNGHYALSDLDLYVSSGIGVSNLKARWLTDPSYTLVTLKSK